MMLKDKIAVVTGGARGIGKEIALRLAREGCQIALVDLLEDEIVKTQSLIRETGSTCEGIAANISSPDSVDSAVAKIVDTYGKIHILINNAGITRDGLAIRMSDSDWDAVLKVNLYGTFYMSRAVAKVMMKQRTGAIVNIASIIGIMGNAGQVNYAASKAGVIGVTKSLAKELAPRNIRVNAIAPGFIATKMTDVLDESVKKAMLAMIPLKRFGTPDDVAQTAVFLSSDMAEYITGQVIVVDGGMVM